MSKQQIGVVGLAVMGKNLALNIESRGFTVSVFNRSREKTDDLIGEAAGKNLVGTYTIEEFVQSLEVPRKILIMVQAGAGTDATIDALAAASRSRRHHHRRRQRLLPGYDPPQQRP